MKSKHILIQSEGLGTGDKQLGKLLIANFLRLLGEKEDKPKTITFWNAGVKLVCEGSQVLEHIQKLESAGVEILACTTCLEYFDLIDKLSVGRPTTMAKSIEAMFDGEFIAL
ncbi:sulfurtransferase-like selenium metabolism protein YedF [Chloroflexota bacterium]